MSSGFSGGYPDFFNVNGAGMRNRPISMMNYGSPVSDFIGKRSLAEFQQQQGLAYLRNVKPRVYNQYHQDLLISPAVSSISNQTKNRLQELEKELLLDEEELENDDVSVVTNTEWSETIQSLLNPVQLKKPDFISLSPTTSSSSSSCASSTSSVSQKQLISEAAEAISDGKTDTSLELLTRLTQISNGRGTPEQRLGFYMANALTSRARLTSTPNELNRKDHIFSTQLLYDKSPCFKLAFMAANNAIMQAVSSLSGSDQIEKVIHVVDFDIGHGLQYVYLLNEIAAARERYNGTQISLKLTTFKDFGNGGFERLKLVGDGLNSLSNKLGVFFHFNILEFKLSEITKFGLMVENDDVLAVNFAFKLNKLPDESVTVDNLRDEVLRRVKRLSPAVVTVAEQELNGNTASFTARVNDVFSYYKACVDSFDATIPRDHLDRVRIEEGLYRRIVNSVTCEGRDRVERCEVFGKWRARMRMAGFDSKPMSQLSVNMLLTKLNSGTRGNPGFTVKEDSGGISFGWLGRTLTVVSAWC